MIDKANTINTIPMIARPLPETMDVSLNEEGKSTRSKDFSGATEVSSRGSGDVCKMTRISDCHSIVRSRLAAGIPPLKMVRDLIRDIKPALMRQPNVANGRSHA
jgi:hypothetical protein